MQQMPHLDFDASAYATDPDAALAGLRDVAGVARSARGVEVLTYAGVRAMLRDEGSVQGRAQMFRASGVTDGPVYEAMTRLIVCLEGDAHRRQRRSVYRWFTQRKANEWRAEIATWVNDWLDRGSVDGRIDLFGAVARPLPSTLFCRIVGAPLEDAERVAGYSEDILSAVNPTEESVRRRVAAFAASERYLRELIGRKRIEPGDDLLSALSGAEAAGDVDDQDMIDISLSILTGSTDTTSTQICLSLDTLAQHPELRAELQRDPDLIPNAVIWLMRFRPGMLSTPRAATASAQPLAGIEQPDPDVIYWANVESANKDPLVYDDPNRLDLTRDFRGHVPLNFGNGRHSCLGQVISLIEQEEVLRACLSRWRDFRVQELTYQGAPTMHFVRSMHVEFDAVE